MRIDTIDILNWVKSLNSSEEYRDALVYIYICGTHIDDCSKLFKCNVDIIIQTLIEENVFEYKICKRCEKLMKFEQFNKQINVKIGLSSHCKFCRKSHDSEHYINNGIQIRNHNNQYMKTYIQDPIIKLKRQEYNKNYKLPEESIIRRTEYLKKYNTDENVIVNRRKYQKNRYDTDIKYRLRHVISAQINNNIKKNSKSITSILNFTIDELKLHLESKFNELMNWDNYGSYWEIDHILPINYFNFKSTDDDEFKKCWSLQNLQPLSKKDNRSKWDTVNL